MRTRHLFPELTPPAMVVRRGDMHRGERGGIALARKAGSVGFRLRHAVVEGGGAGPC